MGGLRRGNLFHRFGNPIHQPEPCLPRRGCRPARRKPSTEAGQIRRPWKMGNSRLGWPAAHPTALLSANRSPIARALTTDSSEFFPPSLHLPIPVVSVHREPRLSTRSHLGQRTTCTLGDKSWGPCGVQKMSPPRISLGRFVFPGSPADHQQKEKMKHDQYKPGERASQRIPVTNTLRFPVVT